MYNVYIAGKEIEMFYFAIYIGVLSIIAFFMYMIDKIKAKANLWRIKESLLLGIGFFGGAVGALLGMVLCHHKTKHWYFWAVNFLGLVIHATIFYILYTL